MNDDDMQKMIALSERLGVLKEREKFATICFIGAVASLILIGFSLLL